MLQCWENTAENRPKFNDILTVLPEVLAIAAIKPILNFNSYSIMIVFKIKPERVQTISDCCDGQLDHLQYKQGEIITVLNKRFAISIQLKFILFVVIKK